MSDEIELTKLHHDNQQKLIHLLMASAGASIGYAIALEEKIFLRWPDLLILLSILFWAVSFISGVKAINHINHFIYVNASFINKKNTASNTLEFVTLNLALKKVEPNIQGKIRFWKRTQLCMLALGAFAILAWRIARAYPEFVPLG